MKIKKRIELSDSKYPQPGEYVKIKNDIFFCAFPVEYNRCTDCSMCDMNNGHKICHNYSNYRCCSNSIHNIIFKKYE